MKFSTTEMVENKSANIFRKMVDGFLETNALKVNEARERNHGIED